MVKFISIEGIPSRAKQRLEDRLDDLRTEKDNGLEFEMSGSFFTYGVSFNQDPFVRLLKDNAFRRADVLEEIDPALRSGKHVVAFDYLASTYAYVMYCLLREDFEPNRQVYANKVFSLHDDYCAGAYPSHSVFLDVSVDDSVDFIANQMSPTIIGMNRQDHDFYEDVTDYRIMLNKLRRGYHEFGTRCGDTGEVYPGEYATHYFLHESGEIEYLNEHRDAERIQLIQREHPHWDGRVTPVGRMKATSWIEAEGDTTTRMVNDAVRIIRDQIRQTG